MKSRGGVLILKLDSQEGLAVQRALAAEQRVKILSLLTKRTMNINEIASTLDISQPTASVHVRVLQEAGLVETELAPTERGSEKKCKIAFRKLVFDADTEREVNREMAVEIPMPVGLFSSASVKPPCGLASEKNIIGNVDKIESFYIPERMRAQILWFSEGWVEYAFATHLPPNVEITAIEFVAEMSSHAQISDNESPSDITVWMNGVEVGTWMTKGTSSKVRGKLNPDWWPGSHNQSGIIKSWIVDDLGSKIDDTPANNARLADLCIGDQTSITVRIGNKQGANNVGGVCLFGKRFGDYPQNLILRIRYRLRAPGRMMAG